MKSKNSFDYDKALKRISKWILILEVIGIAISLIISFTKFLNFFIGSFIAILSYILIRVIVDNLFRNYESGQKEYGKFLIKFFIINMLLFGVIYGIKFLPSRDILCLSLGISIVVISLFIEVIYEILMGKW